VMMAEEDAKIMGLREGERVVVRSEAGAMDVHVSFAKIRPRNLAMYYPEANALVSQQLDPRSKTPSFKLVDVRITRA
jgi:anaerobic selenocysteine-containing dehydrogenase